jgi:hypothetical protein
MSDGTKLVYFVFSNQINTTNYNPNVKVTSFKPITASVSKVGDVLIDNNVVTPSSSSSTASIPTLLSPERLSQSSLASPDYIVPISRGQYVSLARQPYDAYLLNLSQSLTNLTSVDNSIMFPSKVYGTVYLADHTVFMTTWLAYIGYIMAIVIILLHAVYIGN